MADNTQTDLATTAGDLIADEDIAGVKYQRVKLIDATVGSTAPVGTAANPLHVTSAAAASGGLTDAELRAAALAVTGNFFQATQPVSMAAQPLPAGASTEVTLAALKAAVDALSAKIAACNTGSVTLDAATLAALETISISGTVPVSAATLPLPTGAATEASAALPLKQKNSASALSDYGSVILAQRRDSDTPETTADGQYTALKQDEAGRLKVATQPASNAAAAGSITANAQNVSMLCGRFGNLSVSMVATTLVGHNASFECSNNSTNGTDGNWYGVQAVRSNANTVETTTGVLTATPVYMWHVNVGDYLYFRVRATAHTSGTAAYILKPGSYATEPIPASQASTTQPVSGTVTVTLPTPSTLNTTSLATANALLVKSTAGTLYNISASNVGAAAAYLKLYNKATAPVPGTDVPVLMLPIAPGAAATLALGALGHRFALGIGIAITGAAADADTTVIAAAQVKVLTSFI